MLQGNWTALQKETNNRLSFQSFTKKEKHKFQKLTSLIFKMGWLAVFVVHQNSSASDIVWNLPILGQKSVIFGVKFFQKGLVLHRQLRLFLAARSVAVRNFCWWFQAERFAQHWQFPIEFFEKQDILWTMHPFVLQSISPLVAQQTLANEMVPIQYFVTNCAVVLMLRIAKCVNHVVVVCQAQVDQPTHFRLARPVIERILERRAKALDRIAQNYNLGDVGAQLAHIGAMSTAARGIFQHRYNAAPGIFWNVNESNVFCRHLCVHKMINFFTVRSHIDCVLHEANEA